MTVPRGGFGSTSFIINTSSNTPFGVYSITVQATDGAITSLLKVTLDVGDFSISITPGSKAALASSTATYTINMTTTNNYGGNFTDTCSGIPAPAICTAYGSSGGVVSIQTNGLAAGTYSFTVSLSNGVASRSASAQLTIGDFTATLSANSLSVAVGQSANLTITITGQNGFTDAVSLSCNGAPVGTNSR